MFAGKITREYLFSNKEFKKKKTFNLISDKNFKDEITENSLEKKAISYLK